MQRPYGTRQSIPYCLDQTAEDATVLAHLARRTGDVPVVLAEQLLDKASFECCDSCRASCPEAPGRTPGVDFIPPQEKYLRQIRPVA